MKHQIVKYLKFLTSFIIFIPVINCGRYDYDPIVNNWKLKEIVKIEKLFNDDSLIYDKTLLTKAIDTLEEYLTFNRKQTNHFAEKYTINNSPDVNCYIKTCHFYDNTEENIIGDILWEGTDSTYVINTNELSNVNCIKTWYTKYGFMGFEKLVLISTEECKCADNIRSILILRKDFDLFDHKIPSPDWPGPCNMGITEFSGE